MKLQTETQCLTNQLKEEFSILKLQFSDKIHEDSTLQPRVLEMEGAFETLQLRSNHSLKECSNENRLISEKIHTIQSQIATIVEVKTQFEELKGRLNFFQEQTSKEKEQNKEQISKLLNIHHALTKASNNYSLEIQSLKDQNLKLNEKLNILLSQKSNLSKTEIQNASAVEDLEETLSKVIKCIIKYL